MQWKQLNTSCLDPTGWGWQLVGGKYEPIPTDKEPGPPERLKVIRCSCKPSVTSNCNTGKCTCRKNGLTCIAACGHCHGAECLNAAAVVPCDSDGEYFDDSMANETVMYVSNNLDYAEEVEVEEEEVN